MTRKVARSNNNTSSASMMLAKSLRFCSSSFTFGISSYTMLDHAWGEEGEVYFRLLALVLEVQKFKKYLVTLYVFTTIKLLTEKVLAMDNFSLMTDYLL